MTCRISSSYSASFFSCVQPYLSTRRVSLNRSKEGLVNIRNSSHSDYHSLTTSVLLVNYYAIIITNTVIFSTTILSFVATIIGLSITGILLLQRIGLLFLLLILVNGTIILTCTF